MFRGWWIVAAHFWIMFFATGFYTYALPLFVPIAIKEFQTDAATINLLFSVGVLLGAVVSPIAGPLVDRWSARALLLIGTGSLIGGLLALAWAPNAVIFVAAGGLFFGVAGPLCGPMVGSAVISRWFTATRGRALGIAAIGTSVGGFVIPRVLGMALEDVGWRVGLEWLAGVLAVTALPLLLFRFWDRPEEGGAEAEPARETAGPVADDAPPSTSREILRQKSFWLFTVSLSLFLACYTATVANLGNFFADLSIEGPDAASLLANVAIGGVIGKLGFGMLADRIPLKLAFIAAIVATGGAILAFSFEPGYGLLSVGTLLLGVATGGILPVWNALVPKLFGLANFGRTMGIMAPVISLLSAPAFRVIGIVRDSTGSYVPAFQGFLVLLLVAIAAVLPLRVTPKGSAP